MIKGKGVKIVFSLEDVPLGTAGPLALAKEKLISWDNHIFKYEMIRENDVICL